MLVPPCSAYAGDRSDLLMRMRYVAMMMRTGVQCFGKNIANFFKNNFRHDQSIFFAQIFFLTRYGWLLSFPHVYNAIPSIPRSRARILAGF